MNTCLVCNSNVSAQDSSACWPTSGGPQPPSLGSSPSPRSEKWCRRRRGWECWCGASVELRQLEPAIWKTFVELSGDPLAEEVPHFLSRSPKCFNDSNKPKVVRSKKAPDKRCKHVPVYLPWFTPLAVHWHSQAADAIPGGGIFAGSCGLGANPSNEARVDGRTRKNERFEIEQIGNPDMVLPEG